jgi:UDP-glucose 4-epimerase
VREVIDTVSRVAKVELPVREAPRRAGDPPELVADSDKLKTELSWKPAHDSLEEIVSTAYAWERRLNAT